MDREFHQHLKKIQHVCTFDVPPIHFLKGEKYPVLSINDDINSLMLLQQEFHFKVQRNNPGIN